MAIGWTAAAAPRSGWAQVEDPVVVQAAHFDRGQSYFVDKRYELAAAEFHAAYEAKASAALLFDEALCFERMKDYAKAATLFKEYLIRQPQARDRAETERRIAALEAKVLQSKDPTARADAPALESLGETDVRGFVEIESEPAGATIYLDDRREGPLGTTPWNGELVGPHKVILLAPGYDDLETPITGDRRRITRLHLVLSRQQYLGWLEVRSNVAGADVYLDGRQGGAVGRTPYLANVTPGKHMLVVAKEGFTEERKMITIVAGKVHKLDLTLDKAPIGYVSIGGISVDGAAVKLDGKLVCSGAPCRFQSPDGEHRIEVAKPGLKTYERKIAIGRATETEISVKLMPDPPKTDVIWEYAAAAAFVGGGVFLGVKASQTNDEIARIKPPADDERYTRAKVYTYASDACYVIGGITAIVATVNLLSERGPPSVGSVDRHDLGAPSASARWLPSVSPVLARSYAGVAASVSW